MGDPVFTQHADGSLSVAYPDDAMQYLASRQFLDMAIESHNRLTRERDEARAEVRQFRQLLAAAVERWADAEEFIHMDRGVGRYVESDDLQRVRAGQLPRDED